MKKTLNVLLFVLCTALCIGILSCGSTGGGAASGSNEIISGKWTFEESNDANDGGSSTITMTTAEETIDGNSFTTYRFKGEVTAKTQYGLAQVTVTPDAETLEVYKTCKAISFKMLGDGRPYVIEAPISTVKDWGFHRFTVRTVAGEVQEHYIEMRMFIQPAWAQVVRFSRDRLTCLRIQTVNAAEGGVGPYEFKVWDFKLYP